MVSPRAIELSATIQRFPTHGVVPLDCTSGNNPTPIPRSRLAAPCVPVFLPIAYPAYDDHQGCLPLQQRLHFPGRCWYLAQGFPGAAESVDPSRALMLLVARSRYAALRPCDEFPIPSCPGPYLNSDPVVFRV